MRNQFYGHPFTSERDGYEWLQGLEYSRDHGREYWDKWAHNLAVAEITGFHTYAAVCKALTEQPLERWQGYDLTRFIEHAGRIARQEFAHYHIVSNALHVSAEPVEHEATFSELDINERRSDMRLSFIIAYSTDKELVNLASRLIIDEAYHCWFTQLVLRELGDFSLPRLK